MSANQIPLTQKASAQLQCQAVEVRRVGNGKEEKQFKLQNDARTPIQTRPSAFVGMHLPCFPMGVTHILVYRFKAVC